MELTKHGHACVVLSEGERRLVIDPGAFTDPAALDGAGAVLVSHEHPDHFAPGVLRAAMEGDPGLEVWTNGSVAGQLDGDRKSTRLNSSHANISYAVFCLK